MLRTDLPDHRRAGDEQLVAALRRRDPLALAEAYHRTIPAAHATARRLLSASAEVEALLRAVYAELWADAPQDVSLESWIRARCFAIAAEDLRERDAAPASPSLTSLLPELPRPEVRYLDAAERALAELDEPQRRALLMAHDRGVGSGEQDDPGAQESLVAALLALAGPEPGTDTPDLTACADVALIADWVLGLLPPAHAEQVAQDVAARPECGALAKALRRGRRRLEGLPPTPDMGQRILVVVLAGAPAPMPAQSPTPPQSVAPAAVAVAPDTTQMLSGDDTGEIAPTGLVPDEAGQLRRDPSQVYAELTALDEVDAADHPVALPEGPDSAAADVDDDADYDDEEVRRSSAGRVLVWVLGALFLMAGVAAGLYLGLTLLS